MIDKMKQKGRVAQHRELKAERNLGFMAVLVVAPGSFHSVFLVWPI